LLEINAGVYVGNVTARVRDNLWERVVRGVKTGRAVMVFTANNEQGMDFRVHNSEWEPIDFDGIKLILRPSAARLQQKMENAPYKPGYSNAAKYRRAQKFQARPPQSPQVSQTPQILQAPRLELAAERFAVIVDVETTGLSAERNEIIEIGALKLTDGRVEEFQTLIKPNYPIPAMIESLTGITNAMVQADGKNAAAAIAEFAAFAGGGVLVAHNAAFDVKFLNALCARNNMPSFENRTVDTMKLYARLYPKQPKKLSDLAEKFGVAVTGPHRALRDCYTVKGVCDAMKVKFFDDG
jgi:CRISPR-associated protein Cas2